MPGPPPKRSSQRRRQNKSGEVEKAASDGAVRGPDLPGEHSDQAVRWYEALRRSGQAQWFEPSDWAAAELVVLAIDEFVRKPSAFMFGQLMSAQSPLLVTEGDRRRLRVELERGEVEESADVVDADVWRRRLQSRSG